MITFDNFFKNTFARFKVCKVPKRPSDFKSVNKYSGEVSSEYWYGKDSIGEYVIRYSDHWVRQPMCFITTQRYTNFKYNTESMDFGYTKCKMIASCNWQLTFPEKSKYNSINESSEWIAGKCYLSKFKPI
jgi:hypothetical protein